MQLVSKFNKLSTPQKAGFVLLALCFFWVVAGVVQHYQRTRTISVKIIDAQTKEPIEGAVLLSQWTKRSFGYEMSSVNFKVIEESSDANGIVNIPGVFGAGVSKPRIVVYKKGYVAWRDDYIFPEIKRKAEKFKWRSGNVIALDIFDESEYTYTDHTSFINGGYSSGVEYGIFKKAWDWETDYAAKGQ